MPVSEVLARVGSREIQEWIIELGTIRPEEEKQAMDEAKRG